MPQIPHFDYDTASSAQRAEHDRELSLRGRMTNMKRTMLHSPTTHRIYAEWFTLADLLRPATGDRGIWLLSLAIAKASDAVIPIGFFRRALIQNGFDADALVPTPEEAALADFGTAFASPGHRVPPELWERLKARYDAVTLVDLAGFAGIMLATAAFTTAVEIETDSEILEYLPKPAAS